MNVEEVAAIVDELIEVLHLQANRPAEPALIASPLPHKDIGNAV